MRFACLGSGSRGNATIVDSGATRVLIDCGFAVRELERRLARLDVEADSIDAVLVTHEHGDHVRGVPALSRKYRSPICMTRGTAKAARCEKLDNLRLFNCQDGAFEIGDLRIEPYAVPHDAREPSQFVFAANSKRLAMLTDTGAVTPHIVARLKDSDALILEYNHDAKMLAEGPYHYALKRRVAGDYGHLSNEQASALLSQFDHARLQHLVAAHISEKNNHTDIVSASIRQLSEPLHGRLRVAEQDHSTGWMEMCND